MSKIIKIAVLAQRTTSFDRGILRGVAKYSRLHGPWSFDVDTYENTNYKLPWLDNWDGQGIIGFVEGSMLTRKIIRLGLPAVVYTPLDLDDAMGLPKIQVNSESVGQMAADFLLERGFKHFGFCGFTNTYWSILRKKGFCRRIQEAGYKTNIYEEPVCIHEKKTVLKKNKAYMTGWSWRTYGGSDSHKQMVNWVKTQVKPMGLMACNDVVGRWVIDACRHAKVTIPDDIAVIGVDNDELACGLIAPPLSSVVLNVEKSGYELAALLDKLISGKKMQGQEIIVEPLHVEARQSTDVLAIDDPDVAQAARFIRLNASKQIQISDVVDNVGLSRRTLERRFLQLMGHSIRDEIQRVRIQRVVKLLVDTDLQMPQIARAAGFSSSEYMSRVFRRGKGVGMLAYRNSFKNRY